MVGRLESHESTDSRHFEDIWSTTKDAYDSVSIERSAICRGRDGDWRYFTSFVDPADGRWCVSVLKDSDLVLPHFSQRSDFSRPGHLVWKV